MVDALMKTLDTIRGTIEAEVKGAALLYFSAHIQATGQRPESFKGTEGGASASLELRRKGSNIALSEAAVALLREHGLEPAREVVVPQLFGINPTHAQNKELLAKVEAALAGIVPQDFIVLQEEKAKFTVNEETLNAAIAKRCPPEVISCMTTLACKPKLLKTNLMQILEFVRGLIGGEAAPSFGEAAEESKTVKLRLVA
jgi:hypothetical protein